MFSYCCVKWPVCWLQLRLAPTDSLPIIHRTHCACVPLTLLPSPHLSVSHSPHIVFFSNLGSRLSFPLINLLYLSRYLFFIQHEIKAARVDLRISLEKRADIHFFARFEANQY